MHSELLAKSVAAIEPKTNLDQFQAISGIPSRSVAKNMLRFLHSFGIGIISGSEITFAASDRLQVALLAIERGCDIEQVSKYLSWKDFEKLASQILQSLGYKTKTNIILTKPRAEIDVVGINSSFAIAIDCKHWKKSNPSSITNYSHRQAARVERLIRYDKSIKEAIPAIITLHSESIRFISGVPIVPIFRFKSFTMDVKGFLSEIYVIKASAD
jgi:restriction endonuclease